MPVVLSILFGSILILVAGLMAASEIAFFSITNAEKSELIESEEPADKRIVKLLENPKYLLTTTLVCNNLVNIGIIIISYFIITELFNFQDVTLGSWTIPKSVFDFLVNVIVVTFFLVLFGEAIPKVYATHNKFKIARQVSSLFTFLNRVLSPVNFILVGSTSFLERRIKKHNSEIDLEEINKAIDITVENKPSQNDKTMLKGIVQFGNKTVKQVMRPRTAVAAIDITMPFDEVLEFVKEHGYSRLPVYKDSIDHIQGVLHIKDLIEHFEKREGFAWQKLIREPMHTPENKKIDDLLRDFQESRKHLAIVVDEFGGTAGIITLEDVVEEVIGEINDEFDETQVQEIKKIKENVYIIEGMTPLHLFCEVVHFDENKMSEIKGDAETVAGLILEAKGRIPKAGDEIIIENLLFKIISVKNNRIEKVKLEKK